MNGLQPDHYGNRIRERSLAHRIDRGSSAFERSTDLLNRLTGTEHDEDLRWRAGLLLIVFNDGHQLRTRVIQGKEEIAQALSSSASTYIQDPLPGYSSSYANDHGPKQPDNYHTLLPQRLTEKLGGGM